MAIFCLVLSDPLIVSIVCLTVTPTITTMFSYTLLLVKNRVKHRMNSATIIQKAFRSYLIRNDNQVKDLYIGCFHYFFFVTAFFCILVTN